MNQYVTIFSPVPWPEVGITFIQAFVLYWLVLLGLKLVGRRTFSELGPQEIILLLLISEATDLGITHGNAGFWGTVASVAALIITVFVVDRVPVLRQYLEADPIPLMRNGQWNEQALRKHRIEQADLEKAARRYGKPLGSFASLTLEGDGSISGLLKV